MNDNYLNGKPPTSYSLVSPQLHQKNLNEYQKYIERIIYLFTTKQYEDNC